MEKITEPHKSSANRYIFTEDINYFDTDEDSIWGGGDKDILRILKSTKITGTWFNIAAGDGRYNIDLLKKANRVVAADVDKSALSKLFYYTPNRYKLKLGIKIFNVTKKFPFKDKTFDGIFWIGILYLFPRPVFKRIVREIDRVLKPGGCVVIDFATDIKRTSFEGKLVWFGREPRYRLKEAKCFLKEAFENYNLKMYKSKVDEDTMSKPPYRFESNVISL